MKTAAIHLSLSADVTGYEQAQAKKRVLAWQRGRAEKMLSALAARCGLPLTNWPKDETGRPLPAGDCHWSVSHSRQVALAAIAEGPFGVDVEAVRPREAGHFDAIAAHEEWDVVGPTTLDGFFRVWTAKEAVVKAIGVGMAGWDRCCILAAPADAPWIVRYDPGSGLPALDHHVQFRHYTEPSAAASAAPKAFWIALASSAGPVQTHWCPTDSVSEG